MPRLEHDAEPFVLHLTANEDVGLGDFGADSRGNRSGDAVMPTDD